MPKDNENIRLPLTGPIEPAEQQRFAPDEMIRCDECLRANPPTRGACLYCGASLPVSESPAPIRKPILRAPEKHQSAYNNILLPADREFAAHVVAEAASLLKMSAENLQRLIAEKVPLPVTCIAGREEAELVSRKLGDLGFQALTLSDQELGVDSGALETLVKRVKSMNVSDQSAVFQQGVTRDEIEVYWQDVVLVVTGRLFVKRVETQERKKRRAENEIVQSSEFISDEAVIDLYTSTHPQTWRISANGFDFSCLGPKKTLTAQENIASLRQLIAAHTPHARFDDSYKRLRQTLDLVWGSQQETQSSGWRRGFGKPKIELATINSNENQFTRYSRLRRYLHLHPSPLIAKVDG